jgi:hypothetical protein
VTTRAHRILHSSCLFCSVIEITLDTGCEDARVHGAR